MNYMVAYQMDDAIEGVKRMYVLTTLSVAKKIKRELEDNILVDSNSILILRVEDIEEIEKID